MNKFNRSKTIINIEIKKNGTQIAGSWKPGSSKNEYHFLIEQLKLNINSCPSNFLN